MVDCITTLLVFDYPNLQEALFNSLQSERKEGGGGIGGVCRSHIGWCNDCCILLKVTAVVGNIPFYKGINEPVMLTQTALFTLDYNY